VRCEHALTSWQSTECCVAVQITLNLKGQDRMFDVGQDRMFDVGQDRMFDVGQDRMFDVGRLAVPAIGYSSDLYDTQL
jgi:hypothetical protein